MKKKIAYKPPKPKKWFSFYVDGKHVDTIPESALCAKEKGRVEGLLGVEVLPANDNDLIKVNAKTVIPKRITDKMFFAWSISDRNRSR